MAHGYRTLQHWNDWLERQPLGTSLLEAEQRILTTLLEKHYGKHALLMGVPQQYSLMSGSPLQRHTLAGPLIDKQHAHHYIETSLGDLPILTGSVDLVILPHTLELIEHSRQLLAEACRIIKPEGMIAILGFNPYSAWGLRRIFAKQNQQAAPWTSHFIHAQKVKNWLRLADFEMEKQMTIMFRPPVSHPDYFNKLHFLEAIGRYCFPALGGVYVMLARAKVVPLTPIKMKWKQQLSGIRIPKTMSGQIVRSSK